MNKIETGDCREIMRRWIKEGVKAQTCVTSPPYFGLRDYGQAGQLGLEATPEAFVDNLVEVFSYVWDILKDDGTLWLVLGDSYNNDLKDKGLTPKDLIGIPWRVAFALQADGWCLRNDIIWHKPNPMPESVTDRCTKSHEYLFVLTKNQKYFFDYEAIKEMGVYPAGTKAAKGSQERQKESGVNARPPEYKIYDGLRNKRSVWTINTKPYTGAHFATFPPDLIEPCILAGTSQEGECPSCGKAWKRIVSKKRIRRNEFQKSDPRYRPNLYKGAYEEINGKGDAGYCETVTLGWRSDCDCKEAEAVPQIVFDPFMGSGTSAATAKKLGRQYLGCDLNPDNEKLQRQRIASVQYQRSLF